MANSRHYLNNLQVNEPRNWQDLEVTIDWTQERTDGKISLDKLEFVGETAELIIARMNGGLSGGIGYFEGEPYRIEVGEPLNPAFTFEGYLDFTDNPVTKDCNIVEVSLKQKQSSDWLDEVADSFSYRFLSDPSYNGNGKITNSDYAGVPYVINYIPDGVQLILLAISTFTVTKELVESIKSIAEQSENIANGVTPVTGTSVGFGAGVVTAWDLGDIIGAVIKLAITVAYTIGIIYALVKLIEQIVEQLVPKRRFHLGIPIRTLFQKACDYLNMTLSSTLLDNLDRSSEKWVLIPSKGNKGGEPPTGADANTWREVGIPTSADGLDTFGDVIRTFKRVFNADFRTKNGVFQFEKADFWEGQSGWIIPDTFTNQTNLRNETSVNTNEIKANYVIKWQTDQQDMNTLDNQQGRLFQAITTPTIVNDASLVNIKGLETIDVPFSLAVRKDSLTFLEDALKVFLDAADFLTGQLGQPQGFASLMTSRIGSMSISSHFLSIPKMVVMGSNNLAVGQRTIMSAENLWNNYHAIESFVPIDGKHNQQVIYSDVKIPFCFEDFVSLADNNYVQTKDGESAEISNLVWQVENDTATVTYKVNRLYDNNLTLKTIVV
jgi:hypothetical protein